MYGAFVGIRYLVMSLSTVCFEAFDFWLFSAYSIACLAPFLVGLAILVMHFSEIYATLACIVHIARLCAMTRRCLFCGESP